MMINDDNVTLQVVSHTLHTKTHLASGDDVVAPVVGSAAVAPLTDGVGRTDTLSCVGIAVVSHVTALTGCN